MAEAGTANNPLLELYYVVSFPVNVFFFEYAEGTSNNKYLEIYNNTGVDLDLSAYSLFQVVAMDVTTKENGTIQTMLPLTRVQLWLWVMFMLFITPMLLMKF